MARNSIKTNILIVAKHWAKRISIIKSHPENEFNEAQRCFACLLPLPLQKAHIIPFNDTKDNSLENLHLLCQSCHRDSEFIQEDEYWEWLEDRTTLDCIVSMADFEGKSIKNMSKLFSAKHDQWRKDISIKTKEALHKKKAAGLAYTGISPYGKMRSPDGKRFIDNHEEIEIINMAIRGREKGYSFQQIADALTNKNIYGRDGKPWRRMLIRKMIASTRPDLIKRPKVNRSLD